MINLMTQAFETFIDLNGKITMADEDERPVYATRLEYFQSLKRELNLKQINDSIENREKGYRELIKKLKFQEDINKWSFERIIKRDFPHRRQEINELWALCWTMMLKGQINSINEFIQNGF